MGGKIFKIIFIILILFFAYNVFSYNNLLTHPLLSESAAGIYNQQANNKLTASQISWIIKGSTDEDIDPRYLNHFYNPLTGSGLDGYDQVNRLIIKVQGKSAKAWAKNQTSATGDYSEGAILKNYQDGNLARAYMGVGHIIHLIQDMSVPAHTRNDPHAGGDPYEKWAEQYATINPSKLSFLNVDNLDQAFDLMASYSNNNFFSKDNITIDKSNSYKTIFESVDYKRRMYLLNELGGLTFKLAYTKNPDSVVPVFQVDDDFKLNLDYWNMLYPKAVGYSAGVIDYFVKQFAQIDQAKKAKEQISFWGKLKNSLASLKQEVQYAWGDVVLSQRNVLASGYDKVTAAVVNTQDNFQNFSDANREIVEQTASKAGQVLSAFERAGNEEEIKPQSVEVETAPLANQSLESGQAAANPLQGQIEQISASSTSPTAEANVSEVEMPTSPKLPLEESVNSAEKEQLEDEIQPITVKPAPPAPTFIFVAGDSTPPETTISSAPDSLASSTSAEFIFSRAKLTQPLIAA